MDWKVLKLLSPKFGENLIGPSFMLQETHFSKVTINVKLFLMNRIRLNYLDCPSVSFPYVWYFVYIEVVRDLFSDVPPILIYNHLQHGMEPFHRLKNKYAIKSR